MTLAASWKTVIRSPRALDKQPFIYTRKLTRSDGRRVEVKLVLRYILAFVAVLAITTPSNESRAQSGEDGTITVVQPKPLLRRKRLELVPRVSWTFSTPYKQSLGAGGSLYYNVAERFSLGPTFEWFKFDPSIHGTTGRYDNVIDTTAHVPQYNLLDFYGGLDLTYVPAYGKFKIGRSIQYFDVALTLGGGVARNQVQEIVPAFALAIAARVYFNRWLGMTLEYRNRFSVQKWHDDKTHVWSDGSIGLAFNILIPPKFHYTNEEGDQ